VTSTQRSGDDHYSELAQEMIADASFPPERYIRINITKNSKGYSHETTVSLKWSGDDGYPEQLAVMLRDADGLARAEIAEREQRDGSW